MVLLQAGHVIWFSIFAPFNGHVINIVELTTSRFFRNLFDPTGGFFCHTY